MCHQTTYTLPCEHVRTHIVYCADAPAVPPPAQSSKPSSSSSSSSKKGEGTGKPPRPSGSGSSSTKSRSSTSSITQQQQQPPPHRSKSPPKRKPCRNLTTQSIPYPVPPSFQGDPWTAAASPLLPKCPLDRCPFEERNRCWNCCWCGKGWNEQGRCSCVMIIEGNQVRCEHICCETCTAAGGAGY